MKPATVEEIVARVSRLPGPQQEQALAYVRTLEHAAAARLAAFAGSIPPVDLAAMSAAIDADCERVDGSDW